MQLRVIKVDGSRESYFHTKVFGAISNALAVVGTGNTDVAEELAGAVTYFFHHKGQRHVRSDEIFSVIKACLSGTGNGRAAVAFSEHHHRRRIYRSRIEVVSVDGRQRYDTRQLCMARQGGRRERWNKSRIVESLLASTKMGRQTARAVAGMVEDKILNMQAIVVSTGLIEQLVLAESAAVFEAQRGQATTV